MSIELVTGKAGSAHITSDQLGAGYAGIVGDGQYVMRNGSQMAATIPDANTVRVADGDAWMNGRHVTIPYGSYEELQLDSGTQGRNRNDLVVIRYSRNPSTGIESASLAVVKGEESEGTPSDPEYAAGTVMDGSTSVDMPLWRIPISGITPGEPERMSEVIGTQREIQDGIESILDGSIELDAAGRAAWLAALGLTGGVEAGSLAANAANWSTYGETYIRYLGKMAQINLVGTIASGIGTWTGAFVIGKLDRKPQYPMQYMVALCQIGSNWAPILARVNEDGTISLRTLGTAIPARSWIWIFGTFITE